MSLPALHRLRELAPDAQIDLVVGSWNEPLAALIPGISRVETMDARWLSRDSGGESFPAMLRRARRWRERRYDVAINLEGDIRSNVLLAASGASYTAGFGMAGGGPVLDRVVPFDPTSHTAVNGTRLVETALSGGGPGAFPPRHGRAAASALPRARVTPPASVRTRAGILLSEPRDDRDAGERLLLGVHVGAGRAVKEWPPLRLAEMAVRLARATGAAIVLTGADEDRGAADELRAALPASVRVVDLVGRLDLMGLAGVLERLALLLTPDTGPMHLAGALGVPLVAIFGPSSPDRWGPLASHCRIVRVDLPCSPCNRIRRPPARCVGHTPDCLAAVQVDQVVGAALDLLAEIGHRPSARRNEESGSRR
jgi:ADP-heptose:LPS heptosyltransferase